MVRSYYVPGDRAVPADPAETLTRTAHTEMSDLMAVEIASAAGDVPVLVQRVDPILNNGVGTVHGGVAAAALEMTAAAAVNAGDVAPYRTASVRVNFLRPFFAGGQSRYEATPLRTGRGIAVTDAKAVDDDGRVALIARVTAYR
jgi:uncharacterized protein (TIGR00369 family)